MNNENYWTQEKIDALYAVKDGRPEVHLQPLDSLVPFQDHPFQVRQDAEMAELTESIRSQGRDRDIRTSGLLLSFADIKDNC